MNNNLSMYRLAILTALCLSQLLNSCAGQSANKVYYPNKKLAFSGKAAHPELIGSHDPVDPLRFIGMIDQSKGRYVDLYIFWKSRNDKIKYDGVVKHYYPTGRLFSEAEFKNGELDGKIVALWPNGDSLYIGSFKSGTLSGDVRYWRSGKTPLFKAKFEECSSEHTNPQLNAPNPTGSMAAGDVDSAARVMIEQQYRATVRMLAPSIPSCGTLEVGDRAGLNVLSISLSHSKIHGKVAVLLPETDIEGEYRDGLPLYLRSHPATLEPARLPARFSLDSFVSNNMRLSPDLRSALGEADVSLTLLVSPQGKILSAEYYGGVPQFSEEAIRLALLLPDIIPAIRNGVAVASTMDMRMPFRAPRK